jgi:DNA-directed RNA polymerase specialized sigma24 family protein
MVAPLDDSLTDQEALTIRDHVIRFVRRLRAQEPDEIAQETIFRIFHKIKTGLVIEQPLAYARSVAYHVLQEYRRNQKREKVLDFDLAAPAPDLTDEQMLRCMQVCQRRSLSGGERKLLQAFEEADSEGRQRLAEKMGISRNALGLRIHYVRTKLRRCVESCLKERRVK